ncbi:MAG: serpin family protein [Muribaculum sp.]|nr:serpin family protein [Muribaculum sp.]
MNFKGKWKSRFEAVNTRPGVFHNADGSESVVPMMSQETSARIIYREGISAVFLDFADGEFTMQFVMTDGDLNDFAENINSETLQYSDRNPVIVTLPKFDITATYDLKKALTEMGLKADVDDQSGSDGLAMYQDCKTIVDEDGAQAVSVSVASGDGCPLTFTYTFDRPFIYIIKENSTGIIIQMGKVCRL